MLEDILTWSAEVILAIIEYTGYAGVFVLSAVESANIPVPSEVVVPFAGFLAGGGVLSFAGVVLTATLGNLAGSWVSYEIGRAGGRRFLERYGRWFFITSHDLVLADQLFLRFGARIVFIGRLVPIVRTFISFPAGVARMPRVSFLLYTFAGALPWNAALAYVGFVLGENWGTVGTYLHAFDWLIAGLIGAGIIWWIWRHLRYNRTS